MNVVRMYVLTCMNEFVHDECIYVCMYVCVSVCLCVCVCMCVLLKETTALYVRVLRLMDPGKCNIHVVCKNVLCMNRAVPACMHVCIVGEKHNLKCSCCA